jgi:hypothetical protein
MDRYQCMHQPSESITPTSVPRQVRPYTYQCVGFRPRAQAVALSLTLSWVGYRVGARLSCAGLAERGLKADRVKLAVYRARLACSLLCKSSLQFVVQAVLWCALVVRGVRPRAGPPCRVWVRSSRRSRQRDTEALWCRVVVTTQRAPESIESNVSRVSPNVSRVSRVVGSVSLVTSHRARASPSCPVRPIRQAASSKQHAASSMQHAASSKQHAACSMQHAACSQQVKQPSCPAGPIRPGLLVARSMQHAACTGCSHSCPVLHPARPVRPAPPYPPRDAHSLRSALLVASCPGARLAVRPR